ncbi:MAG: hypothetical protein MMC33_003903 [Icmadophila ericetorum]|nr:hypothetical protein [Icmadophila ericetorum]
MSRPTLLELRADPDLDADQVDFITEDEGEQLYDDDDEVQRAAGSSKGGWIAAEPTELSKLKKEDLIYDLVEQIGKVKALLQHSATLRKVVKNAEALYEETKDENRELQNGLVKAKKELQEVKQAARDARRNQGKEAMETPPCDQTPGSNWGGGVKRSAKFPDPPTLNDGTKPTFKVWSKQVENKLLFNADWYANDDPILEKAKVAVIQTYVDGEAANHLYSWLEAKEDNGKTISVKELMQFLEHRFEDPGRRLNARQELKKLKLSL